ncbi:uncharacterized protein DUF4325 [Winogradskyella wandonensis]|uniref:Uncharacterized protein DUF4325 n=1 Tax=Winogradskyella wandonensis TaxID=1442586 RepID=A0A4R1KJV6_9FLAO|nr:STAS-like domain-containing protein [Winogradskyella wandonensis]TCK64680.1 uncharacterized protein DUF4325 [Winogradskyella wandonensis]
MEKILIRVIDFTEYPGVRYKHQGNNDSGEDFYYEVIKPAFEKALNQEKILSVDLDGTAGYASSFLDESFGNLVYDFPFEEIKTHLEIKSFEEPDWIDVIFKETLKDWKRKKDENQPRKPER